MDKTKKDPNLQNFFFTKFESNWENPFFTGRFTLCYKTNSKTATDSQWLELMKLMSVGDFRLYTQW